MIHPEDAVTNTSKADGFVWRQRRVNTPEGHLPAFIETIEVSVDDLRAFGVEVLIDKNRKGRAEGVELRDGGHRP